MQRRREASIPIVHLIKSCESGGLGKFSKIDKNRLNSILNVAKLTKILIRGKKWTVLDFEFFFGKNLEICSWLINLKEFQKLTKNRPNLF